MTRSRSASWRAPLSAYEGEADVLLAALGSGDEDAAWRFKWMHPRFRGKGVEDVKATELDASDARLVVAQEHAFEDWDALAMFTRAVRDEGTIAAFESAVEAVVGGDVDALGVLLRESPDLVRARSIRRHRATLLHYVAANGVEGERQRTPPEAVAIARLLLDAGAEVDALADMYENECTTLSLLVSSSHAAQAGLQAALAETLLDHGAELEGPGTNWRSALMTALVFGFADTAEALARRGAPVETLPAAAGLGLLEDAERLLPGADADDRHRALALAAQLGHVDVVRLLLDAGEDPDRLNPEGFHAHASPLHQAVWGDHFAVVQLLVERGARLDIRDAIFAGTPLDWAEYGGRTAIAEWLGERG